MVKNIIYCENSYLRGVFFVALYVTDFFSDISTVEFQYCYYELERYVIEITYPSNCSPAVVR